MDYSDAQRLDLYRDQFCIDVAKQFIGRCETDATVIALAERNLGLVSLDHCERRTPVYSLAVPALNHPENVNGFTVRPSHALSTQEV